MAAELDFSVTDVTALQVVSEEVNVHLRRSFDAVDLHQVLYVATLRMNYCTHQASGPDGKSGGILPLDSAVVTAGTAHCPTVLPFGSTR